MINFFVFRDPLKTASSPFNGIRLIDFGNTAIFSIDSVIFVSKTVRKMKRLKGV